MSNPTDLLTEIIRRAVTEAIDEKLTPIIAELHSSAPPHADPDELLTTSQVAELTGLSENTLRRWRSDEDPRSPRYVRAGRLIRYRREDITTWLNRAS